MPMQQPGSVPPAVLLKPNETVGDSFQAEIKEVGWELFRFAAGLAAAAVATRVVWHYLNPFRKDEEKAEANRQYMIERLGSKFEGIETDQYEEQIASGVLLQDDIHTTFSDIAGHEELKRRVRELVILPFKEEWKDIFRPGSLVGPPKGVLLWGPPGTGKTMMAKAIAQETQATFINLPLSTLQSQWFGESQSLVRATFSLAKKLAPCIIFIDEIDSFMRTRRADDHQVVADMRAEFMAGWDGILSDPNLNIMVLGTTNKKDEMDEAMMRRLPRRFEVDLPCPKHREQILRKVLENERIAEDFDFELVAKATPRYSGSDLKELCKAGAHAPVRDYFDEVEKEGSSESRSRTMRPLTHEDVLAARSSVVPVSDFQDPGEQQEDDMAHFVGMMHSMMRPERPVVNIQQCP